MNRNKILEIFAVIFIFAITIGLLYLWTASSLETSEKVGITTAASTGTLVIITGIYAWQTYKMAEEMREQRYNLARPVIDIQLEETAEALISAGISASSDNFSSGLLCKLQNIGEGPAIDVSSFIQWQNNSIPIDIGTIAVRDSTKKAENFTVFKDNDSLLVKIYYRDIYSRNFESSRKVLIGQTVSSAESGFGPLKSILVKRSEVKND